MAARRRRNGSPALGHDAFLDIVANLVGILIILVVVLGSRTEEVAELIRSARQNNCSTSIAKPAAPLRRWPHPSGSKR